LRKKPSWHLRLGKGTPKLTVVFKRWLEKNIAIWLGLWPHKTISISGLRAHGVMQNDHGVPTGMIR
jgi:hypothetical protein